MKLLVWVNITLVLRCIYFLFLLIILYIIFNEKGKIKKIKYKSRQLFWIKKKAPKIYFCFYLNNLTMIWRNGFILFIWKFFDFKYFWENNFWVWKILFFNFKRFLWSTEFFLHKFWRKLTFNYIFLGWIHWSHKFI